LQVEQASLQGAFAAEFVPGELKGYVNQSLGYGVVAPLKVNSPQTALPKGVHEVNLKVFTLCSNLSSVG
jgi:hypothetical protein